MSSKNRFGTAVLVLTLTASLLASCASKKTNAALRGQSDLIRAQQEALAAQRQNQPVISFRGPVQRPFIAWRENITLAEALLEAGYNNTFSPRSLRVSRQGRIYTVDVRRLLRGTDNPVLEPGDVVDVVR